MYFYGYTIGQMSIEIFYRFLDQDLIPRQKHVIDFIKSEHFTTFGNILEEILTRYQFDSSIRIEAKYIYDKFCNKFPEIKQRPIEYQRDTGFKSHSDNSHIMIVDPITMIDHINMNEHPSILCIPTDTFEKKSNLLFSFDSSKIKTSRRAHCNYYQDPWNSPEKAVEYVNEPSAIGIREIIHPQYVYDVDITAQFSIWENLLDTNTITTEPTKAIQSADASVESLPVSQQEFNIFMLSVDKSIDSSTITGHLTDANGSVDAHNSSTTVNSTVDDLAM